MNISKGELYRIISDIIDALEKEQELMGPKEREENKKKIESLKDPEAIEKLINGTFEYQDLIEYIRYKINFIKAVKKDNNLIIKYDEKIIEVLDEKIISYKKIAQTKGTYISLREIKKIIKDSDKNSVLPIIPCSGEEIDFITPIYFEKLIKFFVGKVDKIAFSCIKSRENYETAKQIVMENFGENIKVGVAIDTINTKTYPGEYLDCDFAIIDFYTLAQESHVNLDDINCLQNFIKHDIRYVHQELRLSKTKHFIDLTYSFSEKTMLKLINKGLRNFVIPKNQKAVAMCILGKHMATRGKYKRPVETFKIYKYKNNLY